MSRGRIARAAGFAAAALLLSLTVLLMALDRPREGVPRSIDSAASDGRRAAFLLLESLGLAPRAWRRPHGLLPRGRHVLFLPAVPEDPSQAAPLSQEEEEASPPDPSEPRPDPLRLARASGRSSPRHLRGFVEQGGRLLAPLSEEMLAFLERDVGLEELAGAECEPIEPVPDEAEFPNGERLSLSLEEARLLTGLDARVPREALARSAAGDPLALDVPVGRGGVLLLASDGFLDNQRLREGDNALFLVRLVELLAEGGDVLFDEQALGAGDPPSRLALAWSPPARLPSVHLLLVLLLAAWALAAPLEFPRDPAPLATVAPLSRVRAQAGLVLRAGQPEVLASLLRDATLRRLARRAHLPAMSDRPLSAQLERLGAQVARPGWLERARELLVERAITDREGLARLDADLRALEAAQGNPAPRAGFPTAGRA